MTQNIAARGKQPFAFLHQMELIQRKLTNGVVLVTRSSNVFENNQVHSLIAVFVSRAICEVFRI